jgi:hypothetical protein
VPAHARRRRGSFDGAALEGGYRALIEAIDAEAHLWFGVGH